LGLLGTLHESPTAYGDIVPFLAVVRRAGDGPIVAVAMRTPPWRMVLSEVDDAAALRFLADHVAAEIPDLPGITGPVEHAEALSRLIGERQGRAATLERLERAFECTVVIPPRPVSGHARLAGMRDRDRVIGWAIDFEVEAIGSRRPASTMEARIDRALAHEGSQRYWLWEDDGAPVSLSGFGGPTTTGIRCGPVYTPPPLRGRGYASNLVAAGTQDALDRGYRAVFLFTDLANPTANKIYQEIGYRPVRDMAEWLLAPPPDGS
jgi:predicted GNAT family acetyltransferase